MTIYPDIKRTITKEQRDVGEFHPQIVSYLRLSTNIWTGSEYLLIAELITWTSHWQEREVQEVIMQCYERFIDSVFKHQNVKKNEFHHRIRKD